jgi:hypothetical protein
VQIIFRLLRHGVDFKQEVDCSGRCETPAGISGCMETPQAQSAEEAPYRPAESETARENQRHCLKKVLNIAYFRVAFI